MASPVTLYGDGVVASSGWTAPTNAQGAPDATNATTTASGSPLTLTLADELGIGTTTSVEFGVTWTATTTSKDQTCLVELIDSVGTVHGSFTTPVRNTTTLATFNTTITPAHSEAQVNDYRIRLTPQEGGGMPGSIVHYVDSVYAIVTYNVPPLSGQARVMFIGL